MSNQKMEDAVASVIDYLNEVCGKRFSPESKGNKDLIMFYLIQGYEVADFKKIVDLKYSQWHKAPSMGKYLKPLTLFGKHNFLQYLKEAKS